MSSLLRYSRFDRKELLPLSMRVRVSPIACYGSCWVGVDACMTGSHCAVHLCCRVGKHM